MVKKISLLMTLALSLSGCEFFTASFFPSSNTLIENSVSMDSVFEGGLDPSSSYQVKLMDNKLVIRYNNTDKKTRLKILNPDTLATIKTIKQEDLPANSDVPPGPANIWQLGDADHGNFYVGNVQFDSQFGYAATFDSSTVNASNLSEYRLITRDQSQAIATGWLGITCINGAGANFQFKGPGFGSAMGSGIIGSKSDNTIIGADLRDLNYKNGALTLLVRVQLNNSTVGRVYMLPSTEFNTSPTMDFFKKFDVPLGSEDRILYYTADGVITSSSNDKSKGLVRTGWDGSQKDTLSFNFEGQPVVYFSPAGDFWYWFDPLKKKLFRLKTWWRS